MSENILLVSGKQACYADGPARVCAPASKSISHRTLIAACLADGKSRLRGVLESADTKATSAILRSLGAIIEREGDDLLVTGLGGRIEHKGNEPLDCYVHDSGTTCRLLTAVLAAGKGRFRIHGSPRMSERPMKALTDALEKLGAEIIFEKNPGYLPFTLVAHGLDRKGKTLTAGGEILVDTSQTSQYLSGLLLAAPLGKGLRIVPTAEAAGKLVSWSYAQLTLQTLHEFGIGFRLEKRDDPGGVWRPVVWTEHINPENGLWRISVDPGSYESGTYQVEGDYSNASYLLAAGALCKRPVQVCNLSPMSMQGDRLIVSILRRMGAVVNMHGDCIEVAPPDLPGQPGQAGFRLKGIEVNMGDCPDIVPTVAVLAAFADGPTLISGVAHLRIKESDRIAAPAAELRKVGCEVRELPDGMMIIPPRQLKAPDEPFETYNDHRMAMSLALFSCAGFDVRIKDPGCVGKSFPGFWEEWVKI